jgi:UDP-N-acetylmuramoyl-L-alanyl-D-glutamate--2,6-diaminopimelate ligase
MPETARRLEALARAAGNVLVRVEGDPNTKVTGVEYDSRRISGGELFFCIPGRVHDGHTFAAAAAAGGAAALCVERPTGAGLPEIIVSDARPAMARIAAAWWGNPADELVVIGITGTNGKTTTAYLVEAILAADGRTTGLVGTIETRLADEKRPGVRTTPESVDLQRLLSEMRAKKVDAVAMEVTSHGLALDRVEGLHFAASAFTNLTQDHLDFHGSMEEYFAAKRALFTPGRSDRGAVNLDDPYGRALKETVNIPCIGYGVAVGDAEVKAVDVTTGPRGSTFAITTPKGDVRIATPLIGIFNVANCVGAAAVALQTGIDLQAIEAGLGSVQSVPGRFESVDAGQPFVVVVDYAHTPDSLDNVLRAARVTTGQGGRVICVFGCGGDRDRAKRPLMGAVAARLADYVVVTSDNPRTEDPKAIIDAIVAGVVTAKAEGADAVMVDRAAAIDHALRAAGPGDAVVIAGKGHETGQDLGDHTIAFDDRAVAADALRSLGWESAR